MSDSIEIWLKTEAGVNAKIHSYENDFSNGYYFGEIFYTYGINPKFVENFSNRTQMPYILRNYYFLPSLFKHVKVEFNEDIQNALQKKELGTAKQILFKIKDALSTMNLMPASFEKRVGMTQGEYSIHTRAKQKGVAEKTIFQEKKLIRFENAFLQQKEEMITRKKLDDNKYTQIIQSKRNDHLNKMRSNNHYMKEWDMHSKKRWKKTIDDKNDLQTWHSNLENFLTTRIHDKEHHARTMARSEVYDGISDFEGNALRLGIELHKNPNDIRLSIKPAFNPVASMQKIRTKISGIDIAKYEKEKRQRRLAVQQKKDKEIYDVVKAEEILLEKYQIMSDKRLSQSMNNITKEIHMDMILENRKVTVEETRVSKQVYSATFVENQLKNGNKSKFQENRKEKELQLREHQLKERIEKYQGHYGVCYNAVQYMIDMAETCYDEMGENIENQLTTTFWRELTQKFISFEDLSQEKEAVFEKKKSIVSKFGRSDMTKNLDKAFMKYMNNSRISCPSFTYNFFLQDNDATTISNFDHRNTSFKFKSPFQSHAIKDIIDLTYPIIAKKPMPIRIINSLPLRISLVGKDFSGRKTIANKLKKQVPSLECLVMDDVITEVIDLCKKDGGDMNRSRVGFKAKKRLANKKNTKNLAASNEEEENIDASQQAIEFKEVGERIFLLQQENEEISDEIYAELIIKKLCCIFPNSSKKKCMNRYYELKDETEKKILEQENIDKGLVAQAKDPKAKPKDEKKPTDKKKVVAEGEVDIEEEMRALFDTNKYFYTEGFILIGFPNTPQQARILDNMMTGFEPINDRLNILAEEKKETSRKCLDIPAWEPEEDAFGTFDLVCVIDSTDDLCMQRAKDRKMDPSTGEIYTGLNPAPEGDKKLMDRLEDITVDETNLNQKFEKFSEGIEDQSAWYHQFSVSDEKKEQEPVKPLVKFQNDEETNTNKDIITPLANKIKGLQNTKYENFVFQNENQDLLSSKIGNSRMNTVNEANTNMQDRPMLRTEMTIKTRSNTNVDDLGTPNQASIHKKDNRNDNIEDGEANMNDGNQINVLVKQATDDGDDSVKKTPSKGKNMRQQKNLDVSTSKQGIYTTFGTMTLKEKPKLIEKCMESLEKFMFDYLKTIDKDIMLFDTHLGSFKQSLAEMQRMFIKHFNRRKETDDILQKFVENYDRFALENESMLGKDYTTAGLIKKAEDIHDKIWDIIQSQKDEALKDKQQIIMSNYINKEIDKMFKVFLSFTVCEINKVFFTKFFLMYHCYLKHPEVTNTQNYDMTPIELKEQNMPPIDPNEFVPTARINYIFEHIKSFYTEHRSHLTKIDEPISKDYANSLLIQIDTSEKRLYALKAWFILKLKKMKLRYTLFLHRLEDWIVNSIKSENSIIYDTVSGMINEIRSLATCQTYKRVTFDPVETHKIVDFKGVKSIVSFPIEENQPKDYFSFSQQYMILIDIRNLAIDITFEYPFDTLLNHLCFRIKHNHIGQVRMFPESWDSLKPSGVEVILKKLIRGVEDEIMLSWFDITLMLVLWRYPMPTLEQLTNYEVKCKAINLQKVQNISGDKDEDGNILGGSMSFDEFVKVSSWMDEWDEGLCENMTKDTLYSTGYTKSFIYWIFSLQKDEMDFENFFETLKRHVCESGEMVQYRDYFTKKEIVETYYD